MAKILVEIFVPAAKSSFDTYIPEEMKVSDAIKLLSKMINELSVGYYITGNDTVLCDRKTNEILDINMSVYELGIINGSKLMLI